MKPLSHLSKQSQVLGAVALLVGAQTLGLSAASAETTARLEGRCKLTHDQTVSFNGHCTVKQKQRNGNTVFAVELDNGADYRFYGPNKQALQVETHDGIHNVQYKEDSDKGVFTWIDDNQTQRLSVKLDSQRQPEATHDSSTSQALVGAAIGVGVGALIGSLLAGGGGSKPAQTTAQAKGNPYDGKGYTATASFKCSVGNDKHDKMCPGGIRRQGNGAASVTVRYPNNTEVQYDFKGGNVTSSFNGKLDWGKSGDDWYIGIDRNLFIIIPDAAVSGG